MLARSSSLGAHATGVLEKLAWNIEHRRWDGEEALKKKVEKNGRSDQMFSEDVRCGISRSGKFHVYVKVDEFILDCEFVTLGWVN